MLSKLIKKISISVLILSLVFSSLIEPFGVYYGIQELFKSGVSNNVIDTMYLASKNKNVVDVVFSKNSKVYSATNPAENEYILDIGPINGSTTANYVFASFFNPIGSGRTASIKHIAVRANTASSTASNYVNLTVRRISAASAGTLIGTTNIPKKNATSSNSVMEVRYQGATTTLSGTVNSRLIGQPLSGAVGGLFSQRNLSFESGDEKLIIQPGEGIAVYQEAAGTASARVRVFIEWEENTNAPAALGEYLFAFPRVEVATANNYVYNAFFNPASSGKTAVVRRIWFGTETCDAGAVYTNSLVLKRISSSSGGTTVPSADIPKKHTGSSASVMDVRHTNVTVVNVGGTDARIGHVSPCGATAEYQGWKELDFSQSDERLILQQGEGIALSTEGAGNINQIVRMIVEWDEVSSGSTPSSEGEYIFSSGKVASSTVVNATLYSFFNPSGSGKTAVIKRLAIRANATTTATYTSFQFRRLSSASGGTLIASTSLPKKHTGASDSIMEMRWCLQTCSATITASYLGTASARLLSVTGAGAVGQTIGQKEIVFGENEEIILQPGEGIGLYNDVLTSSAAQAVKILIEWDEETVTPSSQGEYLMDIGPINGNIATTYNYISFFNPASSGRAAVFKRLGVRVNTVAAAVYVPMQIRRITSASGGTLVASSSYPKKHTSTATSTMEIRTTGMTVTYAGATTSALLGIQTPGAVASAVSGNTGHKDIIFTDSEPLVLQPGEGIVLYQTPNAGDPDFRVRLLAEWSEETVTPTSLGEYLMTIGPINQSLLANFVYATLFNPTNSTKNFIVRKLGMQVNRSGAATNPTYNRVAIRRITAASAGTLVATTSIAKHTSSGSSVAQVRSNNVTATFVGATSSRLVAGTAPGVVNQIFGVNENKITPGDELVLQPGEGIALYQEEANGDANSRYHFFIEWAEQGTTTLQSLTFTISTSTIYLGTLLPSGTRYASSTNVTGDSIETEAHTFSVNTNASNGYSVSARGQTLTSGSNVIAAIGGTATTSQVGVEQFGIRLVAFGGSGTSTSPYNGSGFAFASTATTSSQVASASVGDNATTTFSLRYVANVAPTTQAANYTTSIIYVVTANF